MAYDLSNVSSRKPSPYISYGGNQKLKINRIELVKSPTTGSAKAILHMETPPITEGDFTPIEGAKGRVGKIGCGVYMKHDGQKKEFLEKMLDIAKAMGVESEFVTIKAESFEEVVDKIEKLFKNKDLYAIFTIFGEEYNKSNGSIGLRLMLPRWHFVEPLDAVDSKIVQFDPNNPNHLKKMTKEERSYNRPQGSETLSDVNYDPASDLPF